MERGKEIGMFKKNKSKRDNENSKIKKGMNILKKANESEKVRSEERKKEKALNRPKGYRAKKIGVYTFWLLFIFTILIILLNLGSNKKQEEAVMKEIKENKAMSQESVEFGKNFLFEYFNWSVESEAEQERAEKLAYYVTPEIYKNIERLTTNKWDSQIKRDQIILKEVERTGSNKAQLTYQVKVNFQKTERAYQQELRDLENQYEAEKREEEKKKREEAVKEKEAAEQSNKEVETTEEVKKEETENIVQKVNKEDILKESETIQYVTLSVVFDEESNRLAIYENPIFRQMDTGKNDVKVESEVRGFVELQHEYKEVQEFLNTFFDAYANDSKEKLAYFIKDEKYVHGLNQTMEFVEVKGIKVYESYGKEDEIIATADVTFAEIETKIPFTSTYTLVIEKREEGYVVSRINDKRYIDAVKNKKIKALEELESESEGKKKKETDSKDHEEVEDKNEVNDVKEESEELNEEEGEE